MMQIARLRSVALMLLGAVSGTAAQSTRTSAYLTTGTFIGAIEEGARIFTPVRLLPFDHPEALGHQFPTVLQLHRDEDRLLIMTGQHPGAAILVYQGASARSAPQNQTSMTPVGIWRGTSLCLVRPSACKDEVVVYRITHAKAADSLMLDARKIIRGEEQEMGVLTCRFTSPNGALTCAIPKGTWQFRVRNDSLFGELRLPDKTKFRDVRAARSQ